MVARSLVANGGLVVEVADGVDPGVGTWHARPMTAADDRHRSPARSNDESTLDSEREGPIEFERWGTGFVTTGRLVGSRRA